MTPQETPLLSIVIVTFRDREELRAILENLRPFARPALEVVVIDGGSQDGTVELLESFEPQPAYWQSAPDRGIYDAMNQGIQAARGTYILHLNAGDRLLDVPWEMLSASASERVDVVCCPVLLDDDVTFVSRTTQLSLIDNTWHHQGTFYRRAAHLGYDTAYRTHADFDHNQRLMLAGASVRQGVTTVASHRGDGITAVGTSHAETLRIVLHHRGVFWWLVARLRFALQRAWSRWRSLGSRLNLPYSNGRK